MKSTDDVVITTITSGPRASVGLARSGEIDRRIYGWLLLGLLLVIILRNAWITEDAYIMFRSIENFVSGRGLVWNLSERVQTFTNPLWTLILSGFRYLGADLYLASIFLGTLCTLVAAWLVAFRIDRSTNAVIIALVPLIVSKAFIDYSTSGLENPMSFLAIALFHVVFFSRRAWPPGRRLFLLSSIASIALLNRMDLLLLLVPAMVHEFILLRGWRHFPSMVLGILPFLLWVIFSIYYYGTPFPNTAYAKLNTGISLADRMEQGWFYLLNSFSLDPITLPVIVLGMVILFWRGGWRGSMVAAGVLLQLVYIVRVGGDFMSGRFLAAPFLATIAGCVAVLPARLERRHVFAFAGVVGLIGLFNPLNPVASGPHYHQPFEKAIDQNGIADERAVFYWNLGFLHMNRNEHPSHHWIGQAIEASANIANEPVLVHGNIGLLGYYADPQLHILDKAALADPLLARLPSLPAQRIGHHIREIPPGYVETLRTGVNKIIHPSLSTFYDALSLVVKAPLTSSGRLKETYRLNTGHYDDLLEDYVATRYRLVHPITDLMDRKALEQHINGWWGFGREGTIWGMQWGNDMLFDMDEERTDTLFFKVTSPFPQQVIEVLYNEESLGTFEFTSEDTLRVQLPLHVKAMRNKLTFRYARWNREQDHHVKWTDQPNAVEFHELGIRRTDE